ncbi:MAG: energy-coupling factor transporter transmembrane protein EcfT [Clostridiales bacterium]|jgi:energy-coupling factor transport system permease protein|nr:energy-coupling factor transporter transmembrane protein EcfT [Clostridiales bacterium]
MKNVAFGQYYPADSAVHRLDPRTKLLFVTFYIIAVFFIRSFIGYAAAAVYILVIIIISKIPLRVVLRSLRTIIFILLFTMVLNVFFYGRGETVIFKFDPIKLKITLEGLIFASTMGLRLIILVTGTSLLSFTTTPTALTDALEALLKPLNYLKINVHDLSVIMSIALRFIPTIQEETQKIISAQKARGAEFDTGGLIKKAKAMLPILIPLFISSFRRADELALALDARCYNLSDKRTKLKELKFKSVDIGAAAFAALLAGLIAADILFMSRLFF